MRWMFPCFEGISLVHFVPPQQEISVIEPLHEQAVRLLGPYCEKRYELNA